MRNQQGEAVFTGKCYECGIEGHSAKACWKLGKGFGGTCDICKKQGHPKRLCPYQPGLRYMGEGEGEGQGERQGENSGNMNAMNKDSMNLGGCFNLQKEVPSEGVPVPEDGWETVRRRRKKKLIISEECGNGCNCHEGAKEETTKSEKELGNISPVYQGEDWEKVRITVDSGAIDHVMEREKAEKFGIVPTEASRNGAFWRAANGSTIKNYGEATVKGETKDGVKAGLKFNAADVTRTLGAVRKMCRAGNRVVFDEAGSYIQNKETGTKTEIEDENGEYILNLWVKKTELGKKGVFFLDAEGKPIGEPLLQGFTGLEDEFL